MAPPSLRSHPYRLNTPPSRRCGSPITGLARDHQITPGALTEPESSPLRPGRLHLHRTRRIPARYLDSVEYSTGPTLEVPPVGLGREISPSRFFNHSNFFKPRRRHCNFQILSSMPWHQLRVSASEQVYFV